MKALVIAISIGALAAANPAWAGLLLYDGFEYTAGQKLAEWGDASGSPTDQYNVAYDQYWRYAGLHGKFGGPNDAPYVASGTLSAAGLPAGAGNSVGFDQTQVGTARIAIPGGPTNSGTVYWSGLLRVNSVNDLTTNVGGLLVGGFNNSIGAQETAPTAIGGILLIRQASATTYQVGTGANTATASRVFADTPQSAGDTVFVVVSYTYVDGSNNDIATMWVNPDPLSFGGAVAPAASVSGTIGGGSETLTQVASFNLRTVNTVGQPNFQFDELRIGDSWASVTPEPATLILAVVGLAGLTLRRRGH